jgi:alpha-ketoglutarate-dependent taurine dioxygenase
MSDTPRTDALMAKFKPSIPDMTPLSQLAQVYQALHDTERELAEKTRALSDETHKQARLARIAELALIDIRTHSRDVDDYLETLEYIAGIANGLKEPK